MSEKRLTGIVTDDPMASAPIGTEFLLRALHHYPVVPAGAGSLLEWDHFGTTLIGLSFGIGTNTDLLGSAVLIGPGLGLCARHVIDEVLHDIVSGQKHAIGFSATSTGLVIWRVVQVILGDTDVAILRLDLASDLPPVGLALATLTTRTPTPGERVMIAGVRGGGLSAGGEPVPFDVRVGVGEVSAIYPEGRDRVMMPYPCVEVRCLTVGGMSGGPAFDHDGNLLGILSSSFEADEGPSYLSLWWPMSFAAIESSWPPGIVPLPTSIAAMAATGAVPMIRPEAVFMEGGSVAYKAWSA